MDSMSVNNPATVKMATHVVLDAKEAYVLMSKGFRVSRNSRAQWYLRHLNNEVTPCTDYTNLNSSREPLTVISCLADHDIVSDHDHHLAAASPLDVRYRITPATLIHFLAHTHRLVFLIDLSPSTASVNQSNHKSNASEIIATLEQCLTALRSPFRVPHSAYVHRPRLYVTIIGRNPTYQTTSKIIYQGIVLSKSKIENIIDQLQENGSNHHHSARHSSTGSMLMIPDESDVAVEEFSSGGQNGSVFGDDADSGVNDAVNADDNDDGSVVDENTTAALMRNTTTNLLRQGMLALNMLPENSVAGMVIITDGVLDFAEMDALDYLMSQVRMFQFSVSFMCVGLHGRNAFGDFGYVPNTDLMQFIATSTFGSFLESSALVPAQTERHELNWYQRAFLLWSFQRGFEGLNLYRFPDYLPEYLKEPQLLNSELSDTTVHLSLRTLLSVRLREGFTIRRVEINAPQADQIEIELVMTWKCHLILSYRILTKWPTSEDAALRIVVSVDAEYTFLHDLIYPHQSEAWQAPNRLMVLRRFIKFYKGLKETEKLLIHLEKFPSNPAHAELPGPVKDGMPVFFIHPDKPLEPEISTDDLTQFSTFTNFWKPICCMDINIWQKWLHTHRIRFLTHYDRPLPAMLFFADSRGRLPVVQCRQSFSVVNQFLREYTDFVLVEDSIYVKFINVENGQPRSYFILRITARPPCIVLRLAFLGSIPSLQRHEHLAEIRRRLSQLTVTQRGIERPPCLNNSRCNTILRKSIERILIQYRETPKDIWAPPQNMMKGLTLFDRNTVSYASLIHALSQNLYHERWIYRATFPPNYGGIEHLYVSDESVNHLLTTLVKMRLAEGFQFAYCTAGIVNLTLEVSMRPWKPKKKPPSSAAADDSSEQDLVACIIQYVIFPPKALPNTTTTNAAGVAAPTNTETFGAHSSPSSVRSSEFINSLARRHSSKIHNMPSSFGRRPLLPSQTTSPRKTIDAAAAPILHHHHHHTYGENLVVLSECWVEPQHGYVVAVPSPSPPKQPAAAGAAPADDEQPAAAAVVPTDESSSSAASTSTDYVESNVVAPCQPQAQYLHDLQFFRIPGAIQARDREAVSAVFTFDALRSACRRTNRLSFATATHGSGSMRNHHQLHQPLSRHLRGGSFDMKESGAGTPLSPALSRASTLKMVETSCSPTHYERSGQQHQTDSATAILARTMLSASQQQQAVTSPADNIDISKRYALAHDVEFLFSLPHVLERSSKYRLLFSSYKEPFDAANTAFMNAVGGGVPHMPLNNNDFRQTSVSTNSANTLLFQHLLGEVREAHDTQVELTAVHQKTIMETLLRLERLQNSVGDATAAAEMAFCGGGDFVLSAYAQAQTDSSSSFWSCFIKAVSSTEVIVTLIPSEWKQVWRIASLLHLPRGLGVRSRTSSRYMLNGTDGNTSVDDSGDIEFARKIGVDYSLDSGSAASEADDAEVVVDGDDEEVVVRSRRVDKVRPNATTIGLKMCRHHSVSASSTESSSATLADGSAATAAAAAAEQNATKSEALSSAIRMQRSTAIAFPVYVFYVSVNELSDRLIDGKPVERSQLDDEFDLTSQLNLRQEVERRKRAGPQQARTAATSSAAPPPSVPSSASTSAATAAAAPTNSSAATPAQQQVTTSADDPAVGRDEREFVLLDICCSLEDSYAKSFVVGVFQGLQYSMQLDEQDVLVAVEGFCEESMLVTDITDYMSHLCPHLKYGQERQLASLLEKPLKRSMLAATDRTSDCLTNVIECDAVSTTQLLSDYHADRLKSRIMLHYNGLFMHHQSVAARDILFWHGSVQNRFRRIIESASFRAVPSSQHYLYYSPASFHEQFSVVTGGAMDNDFSRAKSASTGNRSDNEDDDSSPGSDLSSTNDAANGRDDGDDDSSSVVEFAQAGDELMSDVASSFAGTSDTIDGAVDDKNTTTTTTTTTTDELTSSEVSDVQRRRTKQQLLDGKTASKSRAKQHAATQRSRNKSEASTTHASSVTSNVDDSADDGSLNYELHDLSVLPSEADGEDDADEDDDDDEDRSEAGGSAQSRHNHHPHNIPPLFVHLVVSVRIGRTLLLNVPILSNRAPTCMQQLLSHIDDEQHGRMFEQDVFSLADLNITLDVFGLTLSSELSDASSGVGLSNHMRKFSNTSSSEKRPERLLGSTSLLLNDSRRTTEHAAVAAAAAASETDTNADDNDAPDKTMSSQLHDHFSHLPAFQHQSLLQAVEGVKWLMRDEISHSLLRYGPIVPRFALDHVVGHISASLRSTPPSGGGASVSINDDVMNWSGSSRRGCRHEQVPLNFVFGVDESFSYFMEHFKSIRFYGYKFEERDDLLYLKHGDLGRFFGSPPDRLHIMATRVSPFTQQSSFVPAAAAQPQRQLSVGGSSAVSLRPVYHLQSDPYHGAKAVAYDGVASAGGGGKAGEDGADQRRPGDTPPRRSAFFVTPQRSSRRSRGNRRQQRAKRPSVITAAAVSAALCTAASKLQPKVAVAGATKRRRGTIVPAEENNSSSRKVSKGDLANSFDDAPLPIDNADIRAMLQLARDEQKQIRTRRTTQQKQQQRTDGDAAESNVTPLPSSVAEHVAAAATPDRIGSATPTIDSAQRISNGVATENATKADAVIAKDDEDDDDLLEFRELTAGEADALHAVDLGGGGRTSDAGTDSPNDAESSCHLWRCCTDKLDDAADGRLSSSRKRGRASLSTTPYSQSSAAATENEADGVSGDETSNDELEEDDEDAIVSNRTATGAEKSVVERVVRKKKRQGAAYLQQKHREGASQYWISIKHESLPPFWLILRFDKQAAHVYFHMREPDAAEDATLEKSLRIFHDTVHIIKQACKFVNQMLLLKDMHNTRLCSVLLVPETSDDVWRNKRASGGHAAGGGVDAMSTAAYSVSTTTTLSLAPTYYQPSSVRSSRHYAANAGHYGAPSTIAGSSDDAGQHDDGLTNETHTNNGGDDDEDDDDEVTKAQGYLEATVRFPLGAFECPLVWQTHFVVHSRLKTGPGRHGLARALQALKSVLTPFAVQKRSNLFVYQDSQAKAVFYFRLTELVGREGQFYERRLLKLRSRQHAQQPNSAAAAAAMIDAGATDTFDEMSRATSPERQSTTTAKLRNAVFSPSFNIGGEQQQDLGGRRNSREDVMTLPLPVVVTAGGNVLTAPSSSQASVTLSVFGATEVTTEISTELTSVLQNRLDEAVVDVLSVALARNPNLKLTEEDWKFVMHSPAEPDRVLRFNVPVEGCCTCQYAFKAFAYYLRQNLETSFIAPKFTNEAANAAYAAGGAGGPPPPSSAYLSSMSVSAATAAAQWRAEQQQQQQSSSSRAAYEFFSVENVEQLQAPPMYFMFHCNPQESGKQGIAVVKLMLPNLSEFSSITRCDEADAVGKTDEKFYDIQTVPADRVHEHVQELRNALRETNDTANNPEFIKTDRPKLTFSIWSRGEVDFRHIETRLFDAATYALHDFAFESAVMTKKLLCAPSPGVVTSPQPLSLASRCASTATPPQTAVSSFYSMETAKFMRQACDIKCPAFDSWSISIPSRRCCYLVATQLRSSLNNTVLNLNGYCFESVSFPNRNVSQLDSSNMTFLLSADGNSDNHKLNGTTTTSALQSNYGPLDSDMCGTMQPLMQNSRGVCALNERERDASATQWEFSSVNVMKSMSTTLPVVPACGSPPSETTLGTSSMLKSTSFSVLPQELIPDFWRLAYETKYFKWHRFVPSFDAANNNNVLTNSTILTRQRLVLMFITDRTLTVCLYNCNAEMRRQLDRIIHRIVSWQSLREEVLHSLILQKAGLFHIISPALSHERQHVSMYSSASGANIASSSSAAAMPHPASMSTTASSTSGVSSSLSSTAATANRSRTMKLLMSTGAIGHPDQQHHAGRPPHALQHQQSHNSSLAGSNSAASSSSTFKDLALTGSSDKDSGIGGGTAALEYDEEWRRYDEKPLVVDVIAKHRGPPTSLRPEQAQAIFASRINAAIPRFHETLKDRSPPTSLRYFYAAVGFGRSNSSGNSSSVLQTSAGSMLSPLDVVSVHCRQFLYIRHQSRLIGEQHWRLQKLFHFWLQRERRLPINEDLINLFKRSAEFFHFVATPLLFDVTARARITEMFPDRQMKAYEAGRRDSMVTSTTTTSDAGAAQRRTSQYIEPPIVVAAAAPQFRMPTVATVARRPSSVINNNAMQTSKPTTTTTISAAAAAAASTTSTAVDGIQTVSTSPVNTKSITSNTARAYVGEESWHVQLRRSFIAEYCQYLKNLGYTVIVVKPATAASSPKLRVEQKSSSIVEQPNGVERKPRTPSPLVDSSSLASAVDRHDAVCMQRCLPGGMLFIELRYNEALLTLTCYGLKYWHFTSNEASVQREIFQPEFMDEYDRLRKLSHLHSFSFDRHLLYINRYIMGSAGNFFRPNYHISAFLEDFANYYQKPPPYARSGLHGNQILLDCKPYNVSPSQLFDYLLAHDARYGLKAFEMDPIAPPAEGRRSSTTPAREFVIAAQSAYEAPGKLYECTCVFYTHSYATPGVDRKSMPHHHQPLLGAVSTESNSTNSSGNNTTNNTVLVLSYFLILTSRGNPFPVTSIEEKLGSLKNIPPPKRVKVLRKSSVSGGTSRNRSADSPSRARQRSGQSATSGSAGSNSNSRPTSSGGRSTAATTSSSNSMTSLGMQPLPPIPTSSLVVVAAKPAATVEVQPTAAEQKSSTDATCNEQTDNKCAGNTQLAVAEAVLTAKTAAAERAEMKSDAVPEEKTASSMTTRKKSADNDKEPRTRTASDTDGDAPPVKSSLLDPDREFTYQGYFSHSETQLQQIIQLEVKAAEEFLRKLVEQASRDCFRDYLWSLLVERMRQLHSQKSTLTVAASMAPGAARLSSSSTTASGSKPTVSILSSTTTTSSANPSAISDGKSQTPVGIIKPPAPAMHTSSAKPSVVSLSSLFGRAPTESAAGSLSAHGGSLHSERSVTVLPPSRGQNKTSGSIRSLTDSLALHAGTTTTNFVVLPPYEHFIWLVQNVWKRPVLELDSQLKQLSTLGIDIYLRAMLTLAGTMPHRFAYFASPDRRHHYMLLLNETYADVALLVRASIIVTKSANASDEEKSAPVATEVTLVYREQQQQRLHGMSNASYSGEIPAAPTIFQTTAAGPVGGTIVNKPFPGARRNIVLPAYVAEQQRKMRSAVDELVKMFVNVCMFELWKSMAAQQ